MPVAMRAAITQPVVLSQQERETLESWARRSKTSQALALRARTVLACANDHRPDTAIAQELGVYRHTVGKWRSRFQKHRLDGLLDEPRPGAPRKIGDAEIVHRSTRELERAITEFLDVHNADPKPFTWTKSADQILDSLARFCRRTSDSGH
jgi:transposase